jgi:hypothetical protein
MSTLRWYPLLKRSDGQGSKYSSLLDNVELTPKSFVVSHQLDHRSFVHFNTYLEYAIYCIKKVKESHRCFYEVIFGHNMQKPYFDVDVKIGETSNSLTLTIADAKELRRQVVSSIIKNFPFIKIEDIMIFSSHSSGKYSYHIVVDNWCVGDNEENRLFCQSVMKNVEQRLSIFIDSLVYKSIQQLRIYNCHKYQSDRVKILNKLSKWKLKETPESENHRYCIILGGSLICNTSYCKIVPSLKPKFEARKKWDGAETILDEGDPEKCLELLAIIGGVESSKSHKFPYNVQEVKGSLILLNRLQPSMCRICNRIHDTENPYLVVVGRERKVYFNCRRVDSKEKFYVGKLGQTDYIDSLLTEDQSLSIVPEMIIENVQTLKSVLSNYSKPVPVPQIISRQTEPEPQIISPEPGPQKEPEPPPIEIASTRWGVDKLAILSKIKQKKKKAVVVHREISSKEIPTFSMY